MEFLSRINGSVDWQPRPVPTPEWPPVDGQVHVRRLSAIDRVAFDMACASLGATESPNFQAFLVAFCAVDEKGTRCFQDSEWKALLAEPGSVIERISEAADELNILSIFQRGKLKKKYESPVVSPGTSASPASVG